MNYVVGLVFNPEQDHVVLIHKNHGPEAVVGKWNGVGGKVEHGEKLVDAMVREFQEEAGVVVPAVLWKFVGTITPDIGRPIYDQSQIHFFTAVGDISEVKTETDEEIRVFETDMLPDNTMPNIKWMVQFIKYSTTGPFGHLEDFEL